jgi:hypothetical protein
MTQSFTVTKKGQEINFVSRFETLEDAKSYLSEHEKYNTFVNDLLSRKKVSVSQVSWMHYLATQSMIDSETPVTVGEFLSLVQTMYGAVKSNTRKFQVRLPGIVLSTVNRGVNVGCIYIYENESYAGKITAQGNLIGDVSEDVKNLLEDANDNLLQLAKIYGHETGNCSLCGRTLSDSLSIQMGIGPICAKRLS